MKLRTPGIAAGVVVLHAALIWLLGHELFTSHVPTGDAESVIMASMVAELPAPPAPQPQPNSPKQPPAATTVARTQIATPVALQTQPSPVPMPSATSNAVPTVPAAPAPATAPAAAVTPRPAAPSVDVVLPSSDADYLNNPPPAYPRMSRRMGEQGTVLVRVFINTEGRAEQAEIRTTSGYPRLDEAALDTVKRWRYVPGKRTGQAEAMWFNVPIRFVLD